MSGRVDASSTHVPHVTRVLAALLLAAALALPATPALAWANGGGANGGDGYGSHDWIVDAAVAVLDGRADDWFDAEAARLASDDPDTVEDRGTRAEHVYRDSGRRGGAIARISLEFDVATAAYQRGAVARDAGDAGAAADAFRDASRHIGLLAHFLGDLAQPFHTATEGIALDFASLWLRGVGERPAAIARQPPRVAFAAPHGGPDLEHSQDRHRHRRLLAVPLRGRVRRAHHGGPRAHARSSTRSPDC